MTLLEVLLGVLLLSLIGMLAFSLVTGARQAFERQSDWAARVKPATEAVDALILDLAGSLIPGQGEAPYFRLASGAEGSELSLVTTAPPTEDGVPLSRFRVLRVAWHLEKDAAGRPGLVREARPELASGEVKTERFRLEGVTALTILVYDAGKKEWVPGWTTGRGGALPPAARVEVKVATSRGAETVRQDAVIPAGLLIGAPGR